MSKTLECTNLLAVGQEFYCAKCGIRFDRKDKDIPVCGDVILTKKQVSDNLKNLMEKM